MIKYRRIAMASVSFMGLLMLIASLPMACIADPANWWRQMTPSDFDSDTMTDLHYYSQSASVASVHLEDNQSESYSYDYNPGTDTQIYDPGAGNPVGSYSQSFTPQIDGVVDEVRMWVYRHGNPIDGSGNPATLTIQIVDAVQSGNNEGEPVLATVEVQRTFYCSSVVDVTAPGNQPGWFTYRLTDADSHDSTPLTSGHIYALYVTSNAVFDQNWNNYYAWRVNTNNQNSPDTIGYTKGWNQGAVVWSVTGGGQAAYDYPFYVYVHNFLHDGTLLSPIHDCGASSTFMVVLLGYTDGGTVTIYARTGSTSYYDSSTWTNWINEGTGSQNPGMTSNRYVQFKVEFVAGGNDLTTPGVHMVSIGYDTP